LAGDFAGSGAQFLWAYTPAAILFRPLQRNHPPSSCLADIIIAGPKSNLSSFLRQIAAKCRKTSK